MNVSAVIVGAGASSRMGMSISKQLIKLLDKEVIVHTMLAFERSSFVNDAVIVCRGEDKEKIEALIKSCGIKKVKSVVNGGDTRGQSVLNGVNAVKDHADFIAIHDGARPLIKSSDIDKVIKDAEAYGAAALGVPVKDTVKRINDSGFIEETPNRSSLIAVHTPQVFKTDIYLNALKHSANSGREYTDDCQLAEAAGEKVFITIGDYTNIKITTPEDIIFAEGVLSARRDKIDI